LSPTTDILFILLHLCHYPLDVFLPSIFFISKSTCQAIKIRMLEFLYNFLSPQLLFPDYNYRWAHKKEAFYLEKQKRRKVEVDLCVRPSVWQLCMSASGSKKYKYQTKNN
jgi:hypothetical protein